MNNGVWKVKGGPTLTFFNKPLLYAVVGAAAKHAGNQGVKYAREELRKGNHNDSGLLSHSIKSKMEMTPLGPSFYIYSDLEYSRFVNDGTGIHGPLGRPIVPGGVMRFTPGMKNSGVAGVGRRRSTNAFGGGGQFTGVVYAMSSQGQPAVHFMEKAMARIKIVDFVA